MCYDDGLGAGKNLLALKTTDANQEECSIWVYQCSSSVSRQWKSFKRRVHHKCEVTYPVNECCLFFITCVNRSRLNPSARCCRLLLTVFWHQRSPEASAMEGGWEENNCKNQHEPQQGKWLGFFFLRNWNMVLNLQLWLIFNVTRAQNGTSRNPSAQWCQNIATLCRSHMVHSLVHFTYKPLRSLLCIAVFFRDKQYCTLEGTSYKMFRTVDCSLYMDTFVSYLVLWTHFEWLLLCLVWSFLHAVNVLVPKAWSVR